ncbi:MAG: hypothetical protein ACREJC_07155 [Tepidisphaeraceae bacterium]
MTTPILPFVAGGGGGATGTWDDTLLGTDEGGYLAGSGQIIRNGEACSPRQLKSGRVRYPRHRANGTCYFPRRMNPLNPRAARRAIRRIKAVRRITRDIERSLPRVATRRK